MEEEKDALANVEEEGKGNAFTGFDTETDTPTDSPAVKEPEVSKPEEGGNTPDNPKYPDFSQHPRWKDREAKLKELEEFKNEVSPRLKELDELKSKFSSSPAVIPQWFKEMYGDNAETWNQYQQAQADREEALFHKWEERQTLAEQKAAEEAEQEQIYYTEWAKGAIEYLAAAGVGFDPAKDKEDLVKLMERYPVSDEDGNLNLLAGWEILKMMRSRQEAGQSLKTNEKKKIAALTSGHSNSEASKKDYLTSKDLRHRSW